MWETLRTAWRINDLRKKLLYTLFMLLIYRVLCFVPTPGVNLAAVKSAVAGNQFFDFISMMTGSNMENFTVMAMGITPYINSSIIMQLLTVAIPKLEEMQKEGEEGRKKIAQYTRYLTIALGFLQAVFLARALGATNSGFFSYLTIGVCLAAGTALAMWLGERINENGIGNGISLLIFVGIIARLFTQIYGSFRNFQLGANVWLAIPIIVVSAAMIVGVVLVDLAERRIPVQYAKRMVGRKMYGGQGTHIPLKVNATGVLPLIFASAIVQFPATIFSFMSKDIGIARFWNTYMNHTSPWYVAIFAALVFAFTFFYSSISFNPIEISKNIQQNGGMIPGIRQGKPTSDFIGRISHRVTLFGALFLMVLASVPTIIYNLIGFSLPFVASSLLIAVSVAIETTRQLEAQMTMRHYKGFLK